MFCLNEIKTLIQSMAMFAIAQRSFMASSVTCMEEFLVFLHFLSNQLKSLDENAANDLLTYIYTFLLK